MNILVLNCGSSSVKFQLIQMQDESVLAKGIVEEIGHSQSKFAYRMGSNSDREEQVSIENHEQALTKIINLLLGSKTGVIQHKSEIDGIGHRVVHGGSQFKSSMRINEKVKQGIRDCIPLSPLHNPPNLTGIEVAETVLPGIPQVAVFDTSFGTSLPVAAHTYAIPQAWRETYDIRRYGFHGTSHTFVARQAAHMLQKPLQNLRVITCHLGNGASVSAFQNGTCVETSMGLTPLEGLVMGTRSGDIDPAIIPFIGKHEKLDLNEIDNQLNKKSGMLALTGDADMRVIEERAQNGSEKDKLALDIYCHRIKKYIGAYTFIMGGVDVIVFTAGIGEHSAKIRQLALQGLHELGIELDPRANANNDTKISSGHVSVLLIPTNEELAIARDTVEILQHK